MKLSPYLAFAKKSFLSRSAYRFDHFMGILNTLLRIFIFWGIYLALYNGKSEVDGVTMTMVTTNFILSMGLSTVFCVNDFYLPNRIQNGSIANEMLLPVSIHGRMLADNLGNALFQLVFHFIPAVVISVLVIGIHAPASFAMFALFLLSAIFGYGVLWTISFALQMLAFWLINVWSIMTIKNVFINVLSGSMIPLWFMPDWMKGVLTFTPFSSIYFTPVQIYLGQLSVSEIIKGFGIQLLWILLFVILGKVLWRQGQKKLVVQGG
ncbi:MAG: ABC-2 family transporter protein [Lachnospiraceae bacterium]|nr:ABC-2 family transporter protein [Lachnospiraceae bacterium]